MTDNPNISVVKPKTQPRARKADGIGWYPTATVRKYDRDGNFVEEVTSRGNILTQHGRARLASLLAGEEVAPLNEDYIRIGVGDNAVPADISDETLATDDNEYYMPLDHEPSVDNGVVSFTASFQDDDANFQWTCWGLDVDEGGDPTAGAEPVELFNRKVFNFGEKDGGLWQLTVTISTFDPGS